jgi:hypothetical protein
MKIRLYTFQLSFAILNTRRNLPTAVSAFFNPARISSPVCRSAISEVLQVLYIFFSRDAIFSIFSILSIQIDHQNFHVPRTNVASALNFRVFKIFQFRSLRKNRRKSVKRRFGCAKIDALLTRVREDDPLSTRSSSAAFLLLSRNCYILITH